VSLEFELPQNSFGDKLIDCFRECGFPFSFRLCVRLILEGFKEIQNGEFITIFTLFIYI
jgi:hypothetical protein